MKTHDRALVSITGATALVGILAAIAVTASLPSGQRDFITISGPVQLLISVGVPFLGVLMMVDLHRSRRSFLPTLLRALGAALAFAGFGAAATAVAVAAFPSDASEGRWSDAGVVLLGSVLVQVVAQLTGTGLGLLIRRPVVA
jgi:peptidoglycan/LPS O-acetylase OafA/YrhL